MIDMAKLSRMLRVFLILAISVIGGGLIGVTISKTSQDKPVISGVLVPSILGQLPVADLAALPSPELSPSPRPELPAKLSIPKLKVDAAIEYVGLDAQRRMDVPKDADNVAWYELGVRPGEIGNAAIAGHLDSATGPAVFYNLEKLAIGDEIAVTNAAGGTLNFKVTKKATYQFDQFPLQEVFGPSDAARLNLITCEGQYDDATKNYSQRVVVYTELIRP